MKGPCSVCNGHGWFYETSGNETHHYECDHCDSSKSKRYAYMIIMSSGSQYDREAKCLFVTHDKGYAEKYIKRYESILERWRKYYERFEESIGFGYRWIADEHEAYRDRWSFLNEFNEFLIEEIEIR